MSALLVLPLAITRGNVAHYVNTLLDVYIVLIFIRILMSWVPRVPYYRWLDALLGFVREVTDPYLNFFRRFLPPLGGGGFALDLSPILGVILLFIVRAVIVGLIEG